MSAELIRLQRNFPFSFEEVTHLLPTIQHLTAQCRAKVEPLFLQIELLSIREIALAQTIEAKINQHLLEWHRKVARVGGQPKALWTIEFDCGDGFYGWSFPDHCLSSFRKYDSDFSQRRSLDQRIHRMG